MHKRKSQTQELSEAKVFYKHGCKIGLKKLWEAEQDKELQPEKVD